MSEQFVSKAGYENGGLTRYLEICKGGKLGGTSGKVTDDSETFRLDDLESEAVG